MPNRLTIEIGANTYSIPLKGTVSQIRDALMRYAVFHGIPLGERTNQDILNDVLLRLKKDILDTSREVQRQKQVGEQLAAIEEQVSSDNDI